MVQDGLRWRNNYPVDQIMRLRITGTREFFFFFFLPAASFFLRSDFFFSAVLLSIYFTDSNYLFKRYSSILSALVRQKRVRGGDTLATIDIAAATHNDSANMARSNSSNSLGSPRYGPYVRSTNMSKSRSDQAGFFQDSSISSSPRRRTQTIDQFSSPYGSPVYSTSAMARSRSYSNSETHSPATPKNYRLNPLPIRISRDLNKEMMDPRASLYPPPLSSNSRYTPPSTPDASPSRRSHPLTPSPSFHELPYSYSNEASPSITAAGYQANLQQILGTSASWTEEHQPLVYDDTLIYENAVRPFASLQIVDPNFTPFEIPTHEQHLYEQKYGAVSQPHPDQLYLDQIQVVDYSSPPYSQLSHSASPEALHQTLLFSGSQTTNLFVHPGHDLAPEELGQDVILSKDWSNEIVPLAISGQYTTTPDYYVGSNEVRPSLSPISSASSSQQSISSSFGSSPYQLPLSPEQLHESIIASLELDPIVNRNTGLTVGLEAPIELYVREFSSSSTSTITDSCNAFNNDLLRAQANQSPSHYSEEIQSPTMMDQQHYHLQQLQQLQKQEDQLLQQQALNQKLVQQHTTMARAHSLQTTRDFTPRLSPSHQHHHLASSSMMTPSRSYSSHDIKSPLSETSFPSWSNSVGGRINHSASASLDLEKMRTNVPMLRFVNK